MEFMPIDKTDEHGSWTINKSLTLNFVFMRSLKLISILLLVISVVVFSCSKGTAGPAGPAGPGNVQHTVWTVLNTPYAGQDTVNNDSVFVGTVTAASVTQTILDSGLVLTYLQNPNGSIVEVSDLSTFLDVSYAVGTITLTSFVVNLTGYNFRYIIVPGTTKITSALNSYTKEQLRTMSYSNIVKLLEITDKPGSN
jgi:hypothetical protein